MDAPVCRLTDVSHRYGRTKALDGITLDIPGGCLAGIIGPDGVGKSTLLGLLAGTRRPQQGAIEIFGVDGNTVRADPRLRGRIAFMPQGLGSNLYPTLSVAENLLFFARLFSLAAQARELRMRALLAATGMLPFADRAAGKLSGGMKQKLGLCCALIHDPELLILDEPTTGVDPLSRRQFWQLLAMLRKRRPQLSVLVASAYMEEAEQFDWLAMFDAGHLLDSGAPAELKQRTGAANLDEVFMRLLPGGGPPPLATPPPLDHAQAELAIEARDLTRRFGEFTAVDRVSFAIHKGEIFGFLGSNGCGKTTTMKMLTGLLPASEGEARLFGEPVNARSMKTRLRIGYMSQSFSLYEELTVLQNLQLHGRIYGQRGEALRARCEELMTLMQLEPGERAGSLPLGVRQRLSLAVAIIHQPELLILDEPTSGVDPVARDQFWALLLRLARDQGVTIFISTHYLNEAERCDRLSLMHAGRVLAQGTPAQLRTDTGSATLEEAFIKVLEQAAEPGAAGDAEGDAFAALPEAGGRARRFDPRRLLAVARREAMELWREPLRVAFALLGPLFLLLVMGYGLSFDVENLRFAALDRDNSAASRAYLEQFRNSRYFDEQTELADHAELQRRLIGRGITLAVEIPPGYGRDLAHGRPVEVGFWIDGSTPFQAEVARNYVEAAHQLYLQQRAADGELPGAEPAYTVATRFRYNPAMESVYSIVPGMVALLMTLIPAMLLAVAVVREKELGSIMNFYATPTHRLEFLWGKQLPYVAIGALNYVCLLLMTRWVFGIPLKGSMTLLLSGGLLFCCVATAIGLLVSVFTRTQVAALFAALIVTMVPAMNFSGLIKPVAALEGAGAVIGHGFPTGFFLNITVGAITKGLGFAALWPNLVALAVIFTVLSAASALLLRKDEK